MAASSAGGFRAALMESPPVDVWRLPSPKVALAYAFTGESASTRVLISRVESRLDEAARLAFVARSDAVGLQIEAGLGGGDFRALAEAVSAQQRLLQELGSTETEAMRRILAIASSYGCAGKQSGAGGGDGCILFAPTSEARAELMNGLEARGFHSMALELEPGLRGEGLGDLRLRAWVDSYL
jgi:phosphomevalonate kinase